MASKIEDPQAFEVEIYGSNASVTVHLIRSVKIFHIVFDEKNKPLNITVAENSKGEKFWTSVPEGRQEEAEILGKAIGVYLREYRRTHLFRITEDKKLSAPGLFD